MKTLTEILWVALLSFVFSWLFCHAVWAKGGEPKMLMMCDNYPINCVYMYEESYTDPYAEPHYELYS